MMMIFIENLLLIEFVIVYDDWVVIVLEIYEITLEIQLAGNILVIFIINLHL
jgi:hypothetical protein